MEHFIFLFFIFLFGKCLFSRPMNPPPPPFDMILMVLLQYILPSLLAPSASTLCHLVNGRQVLSSKKQRTGKVLEQDHMSPIFIFKNIPHPRAPHFIAEC